MKSRIEFFHMDRLKRIGMEWKMDSFRTLGWSKAKILKEFRDLPENLPAGRHNPTDFATPTPKTDAEMAFIIANSRECILIG